MADYKYLLPQPDEETKPFWDATKKHELHIQRCADCKQFRHPPGKTCPSCYSENFTWEKVSGRGKIYSYIRVFQPVLPQWRESPPYNIVQVALDEDAEIILTGNVVAAADAKLKVGLPVKVTFDDVSDDVSIPRWTSA